MASVGLCVLWNIGFGRAHERVVPVPRLTKSPRSVQLAPRTREDADAHVLEARDERECQSFRSADLSDYDLTGSSFSECEFTSITLTNTQFRGSRFSECRLIDPFAPTFLAARTSWREVIIENPRWGSAELFEADATGLHIQGGKIDYLNLRTSRLTDVVIEDCAITDLDLGGSRATRVALRNCRIGTLDLTRASMADVDLRTSTFLGVNGLEGLRGTTIDDYQLSLFAPLFATHLGITVE